MPGFARQCKMGDTIAIGENVRVTINVIRNSSVRIYFEAPREMRIQTVKFEDKSKEEQEAYNKTLKRKVHVP